MAPPPYPRIPYLWPADSAGHGDRVVPLAVRSAWLRRPVVVEEKLDGANVSIWSEDGRLQVASRGGPGAMDRGGQLGPLRARVDRQYEVLRPLLDGGLVLYAEWLWLSHTVVYDRLPDHLVVLDVLRPDAGFVAPQVRDELCLQAGLIGPPQLYSGVLRTAEALLDLIGLSRFGSMPMEGVVLRRDDGQVCKVVRPGFVRAADNGIGRQRNALVRGTTGRIDYAEMRREADEVSGEDRVGEV
jgi:RNA ligase